MAEKLKWPAVIFVLLVCLGPAKDALAHGKKKHIPEKTKPAPKASVPTEDAGKKIMDADSTQKSSRPGSEPFEKTKETVTIKQPDANLENVLMKERPLPAMEAEESSEDKFSVHDLVEPLGISTLTLMFLAATAGFFMRKSPQNLMKAHQWLAISTLISAGSHAVLVLFTH